MIDYNDMLLTKPYALCKDEKEALLSARLIELSKYHYEKCSDYKKIVDILGVDLEAVTNYYELPFIPVRLFKDMDLKSIDDEEIFKVMTSSGTTGQKVSKIYLDKITASNQQKTLVKIVSEFTGKSRLPMLIIDSPAVVKNRAMFSARGAGILGFSIFGSDKLYALNEDMTLNYEAVQAFLEKHKDKEILVFGFTFMIWQYFYKVLKDSKKYLDLSKGIMIHGGGWKKLAQEAVEPLEYHKCMQEVCGIKSVSDYYGMVEQTGCVYMECKYGHLHSSIFSDVITRRSKDFSRCDYGEKGIIQVVSAIPESYPGHSLLTEDEGIILGEDDCPCGKKGKYFKILGRVKNAEVRGCSDTYEKD